MTTPIYKAKLKHIESLLITLKQLRRSIRKYISLDDKVSTYITNYIERETFYLQKLSPHLQENTISYMQYLQSIQEVIEQDISNRMTVHQSLLLEASKILSD